jgi:hypothetical protein
MPNVVPRCSRPSPTPHPCAGHPCDHCYVCDVLHVCCCSISAQQRAQLEAERRQPYAGLVAAIVQKAGAEVGLPELVRRDARHLPASARLGLLAPRTTDPVSHNSRKEAVHVLPARSK